VTWGENLSYGDETGKDVILSLIIDDGEGDRGHRNNIFDPKYKQMGTFSGKHKKYETMSCIDYAGGWGHLGQPDPVKAQMDLFMKEEVKFEDKDEKEAKSWKQKSKIKVRGTTETKTVTRTYKMKDGATKMIQKEVAKQLHI
jgi:hypothetical protein